MKGPKPVPHPDDVIVEREISEVGSRVRCCKSRRTLKTRFVKWLEFERDLGKIESRLKAQSHDPYPLEL
jgi:hypothetical protein